MSDDDAFWHACTGTPVPVTLVALEPLVLECELRGFKAYFDDGFSEIVLADAVKAEVERRLAVYGFSRLRRWLVGVPRSVYIPLIEAVAMSVAHRQHAVGRS